MTLMRPRGLAGRRDIRFLAAGFASVALLVGMVAPAMAATPVKAAAAGTQPAGVKTAQIQIKKLATPAKFQSITQANPKVARGPIPADEFRKGKPKRGMQPKKGYYGTGGASRLALPQVASLPVVNSSIVTTRSGAVGHDGISGTEMRYASPDGTRWNYSLEPPDMALCVGNGYVVQAVNGAVQVFSSRGAALTAVTPANAFLGWEQEYPVGPSVGDPRCQYDPATRRFFMSWYMFPGPSGALGTVLAVSTSSNPLGMWTVWELPDAGDFTLPGCLVACFPDYPQLGLDANAVWITNNEFDFGQGPSPYAGATIWGISKRALVEGYNPFIYAWVWGLGFEAGVPLAFTVQPAVTPSGGYDSTMGGTQYFMATRDMDGTRDNVLDVWMMTGTSGLNLTSGSAPWLSRVQLTGQTYACDCIYGAPGGGATQKYGPYPLGQYGASPIAPNQNLPRLDTNDDRMHQVIYSNGMLWGAASTVMNVVGQSATPTVGVAWWTVRANPVMGASIYSQGYIGVKNSYLWFPAMAVSSTVRGVVAMTFSGPDRYPSTAYAQIDPMLGASSVRVAAAGTAPADGFTAYSPYSRNGTERWGDYSAAATDESGNVWFATEMIGKDALDPYRAAFINWGTWIGVTFPQ